MDMIPQAVRTAVDVAQASAPRPGAIDGWPDPVPFEAEAGPPIPLGKVERVAPVLFAFANEVADAIQAPADGVLMAAFTAMGAACRGVYSVRVSGDHVVPVNMYAIGVMDSAERKSAVIKACQAPLVTGSRKEVRDEAEARARRKAERAAIERRIAGIGKRIGNMPLDDPGRAALISEQTRLEMALESLPPIREPALLVTDTTMEALAADMAGQRGVMAVMDAEGRLFDHVIAGYNGMSNTDVLKKGYDGEPLRISRKTCGVIDIPRPILNVMVYAQQTVMRKCARTSFREEGVLARFLYVCPASMLGRRKDPRPANPDVVAAYEGRILAMLAASRTPPEAAERRHAELALTPQAADMALAFERTLEPLLAEGQELHHIRDWAGKLPSRVVRMAALLHMFRDGWETTSAVGADCMEASTEMAVALIEHTKVVFSLLGTNEQAEAARHILGRIVQRRCTLFTARDVLRWTHSKTGLETMAAVRSGLDILVERGHVAPHEGIEPRRAGRPTEAYHVNPKVFLRRR